MIINFFDNGMSNKINLFDRFHINRYEAGSIENLLNAIEMYYISIVGSDQRLRQIINNLFYYNTGNRRYYNLNDFYKHEAYFLIEAAKIKSSSATCEDLYIETLQPFYHTEIIKTLMMNNGRSKYIENNFHVTQLIDDFIFTNLSQFNTENDLEKLQFDLMLRKFLEELIEAIAKQVANNSQSKQFQIQLFHNVIDEDSADSPFGVIWKDPVCIGFTTFNKSEDFRDDIKKMIKKIFEDYQWHGLDHIIITEYIFIYRPIEFDKVIGKGSNEVKYSIDFERKCVIVSPITKTNCLYMAYEICVNDNDPNVDYVLRAKRLKARIDKKYETNKHYSTPGDIQNLANYTKTNIILYDQYMRESHEYISNHKISRRDRRKTRDGVESKFISIINENNHFKAVVYKSEDELKDLQAKLIIDPIPGDEDVDFPLEKITKRFKPNQINFNFATFDLETSVYKEKTKEHEIGDVKSYAIGFYDGEKYNSWFSLECIKSFFDWLYDHAEDYNNWVFYAHNGGKFDQLVILSEYLLASNKWYIRTDLECNIELNGRWLNIVIYPKDKTNINIYLRDSFALLPQKLDNLCKEFDVKHKKLTETVNHNEITLDNFNSFPQLPKYLENDCIGLHEVLSTFNFIVWNMSKKDSKTCKSENRVKAIYELLVEQKFEKIRPDFLNKLELDGYCDNVVTTDGKIVKLAFEYNGEQHYKPNKKFNKNISLDEIKRRDKVKFEECLKNGVILHVIPYYETKKDGLFKYIKELLRESRIKFRFDDDMPYSAVKCLIDHKIQQNLDEKTIGLNITDCFTASTLSKKLFYIHDYNQYSHPIYTLPSEIDKYVRNSYYGGRCEIFYQGVKNGKFYYYDFTSLYPDVGRKLLPFGEPIFMNGEDIDIINFYGFIRCMVRQKSKEYKNLHAIYDNKLLFPYIENWTEMTLFSEEIKLGMKHEMYEYQFLDGYRFEREHLLKNFFENGFKRKDEASKEGKGSIKYVWKLIINSGYGFFGLRREDRTAVKIFEKGKAPSKHYAEHGMLFKESDIGNYTLCKIKNTLKINDCNVAIAAAITSYARMKLWNTFMDIELAGGTIYYCDTDSIICDLDLDTVPHLKKRYQPDIKCSDGTFKSDNGDGLGSLKNELNSLLKKNDKQYYFNKLALVSCKFYGVKTDEFCWEEGESDEFSMINTEICKCRGLHRKIKFHEFEDQFQKYDGQNKKELCIIDPKQQQFKAGYRSYLDTQRPFQINIAHVEKKGAFDYTKAKSNIGEFVIPLIR